MASGTPLPEDIPAAPPHKGWHWYWLIPLGLTLLLLYAARTIITPFVIGVVLAYLLDPFVATVHRLTKLPRTLVVVAMALLTLAIFGTAITILVRLTANDGQQFVHELPTYLSNLADRVNELIAPTTIQIPKDAIPGLGGHGLSNINLGEVLSVTITFATNTGQSLLDFLITFVSTIYLLLDGHHLASGLQRFVPPNERQRLSKVMGKVRKVWSSYIRAQLFLAALMAFVSWIVLQFIFQLKFALPVALAVGLLETVPIVGPLVALALAGIVALATGDLLHALFVVLALYVLRLTEDHVVIPYVLGRAIHLPAIVTLFSVAVGGIVGGLVGVLLAVPIAAAVKVVIDEYYPHPRALPDEEPPQPRPLEALSGMLRKMSGTIALPSAPGPAPTPATTPLPESSQPQASQSEASARSSTAVAVEEKKPGQRSRKKNGPSGGASS